MVTETPRLTPHTPVPAFLLRDREQEISALRARIAELEMNMASWEAEVYQILATSARMQYALEGAMRVLDIAASYDPQEWPHAGLRIHCADAKLWAVHAREALRSPHDAAQSGEQA